MIHFVRYINEIYKLCVIKLNLSHKHKLFNKSNEEY